MANDPNMCDQLLEHLAEAIDSELTKRGSGWFGRPKALWKLFTERHKHLRDQDGDAFTVTFGEEFAQAYKEFSSHAPRPSIVPAKKSS